MSAATVGPQPASAELLLRRIVGVQNLVNNSIGSIGEERSPAGINGSSHMVLRRRKALLSSLIATIVSLATSLAVAFLVMQCFRAVVAKDYRTGHVFRRLLEDRHQDEMDFCRLWNHEMSAWTVQSVEDGQLSALTESVQ
ncbi:hypothetical protein Efla_006867 [Eimeria flavescens]